MLSKKYRVPREMFGLLSLSKQTTNTSLFFVRFSNSKEDHPRICFSISKKISKSAVLRNKMRRNGYRAVQEIVKNMKNGVVLIFSFKKIPEDIALIKKEVHTVINKIQNQ